MILLKTKTFNFGFALVLLQEKHLQVKYSTCKGRIFGINSLKLKKVFWVR